MDTERELTDQEVREETLRAYDWLRRENLKLLAEVDRLFEKYPEYKIELAEGNARDTYVAILEAILFDNKGQAHRVLLANSFRRLLLSSAHVVLEKDREIKALRTDFARLCRERSGLLSSSIIERLARDEYEKRPQKQRTANAIVTLPPSFIQL